MAITFLQAVTEVLARAGEVPQDVDAILSFSDSARSQKITQCRQAWNDVLLDISTILPNGVPKLVASGTITLQTNVRSYTLPTNFTQIVWPLIDTTQSGWIVPEYPGGFEQMVIDRAQPELYVGVPAYAVIDPTNGELLIDTTPDEAANGKVFKFYYYKSISMVNETDLFPFSDDAIRALYGAVAEAYKYERQRIYDSRKYNMHKATAIRLITPNSMVAQW